MFKAKNYTEFKNYAVTNSLSVWYVEREWSYSLEAYEGTVCVMAYDLGKDSPASADQVDFETTLKPTANSTIKMGVFDEFTSSEKIPQFACAEGTFDGNNECILEVECPGTFPEIGRYLKDGYAFTDSYYFGDKVSKLEAVDTNFLLAGVPGGYPATPTEAGIPGVEGLTWAQVVPTGVVVKSYHDTSLPEDKQGWFLWAGQQGTGEVDLENAGGWGLFISQLTLRATIKKKPGSAATKAAINIFWATDES